MKDKIVCAICKNEENKRCLIKKVSVAINKKRRCDKFIFEPTKVKEKQILKTIRMPYREKEELRQRYKKELKRYNQLVKNGTINKKYESTSANPTTGDLSRFVSTAGNKKSNG